MTITTDDLHAIIDLTVLRLKQGLINAMNATGNSVAANISDTALADKAWNVFVQKGFPALQNVLSRVAINKSNVTDAEAKALRIKLDGINPNAKFKDWFNNLWTSVGDLVGGSSTTVIAPVTQSQTSSSALPTWAIIATVAAGLGGIFLFRKFQVVVIGIIVIVMGIFLYGIFVRNTSTTVTGGGTTTEGHGGVGDAFFGWVGGILGGIGGLFTGGGNGGGNLPDPEDYR